MRVLHLVPEIVSDPGQYYLGSTKDVHCRTEYFDARGITAMRVAFTRGPRGCADALSRVDLAGVDVVFVETIPLDVVALRRHTDRPILIRSQNAELLHRLDWARAATGSVERLRYALRGVRGLVRELAVRGMTILPITDWESDHYYRGFVPGARRHVVPFYLTAPYAAESVSTDIGDGRGPSSRPQCVLLGTTSPNPLIAAGVRSFNALVRGLPADLDCEFAVTGDVPEGVALDQRITTLGLVASPAAVLSKATHVVLPSQLGYGFKTKILEALLADCRVMVDARLHRRLPAEVQACCEALRPRDSRGFADWLTAPIPTRDPSAVNVLLRARAWSALDRALHTDR